MGLEARDAVRRRRCCDATPADLCEGLTEVHLCRAAQGFEASQAVSLGHSVLMLHGLASAAECEALRTDAVAGAAVERVHASRESRIRMQLETLREPSVALYDHLLLRACERVKEILPTLLSDLFGADCLDDATLVRNDQPLVLFRRAGDQRLPGGRLLQGAPGSSELDGPHPAFGQRHLRWRRNGILVGGPAVARVWWVRGGRGPARAAARRGAHPARRHSLLFWARSRTPTLALRSCLQLLDALMALRSDLAHSAHHGSAPEISAEHSPVRRSNWTTACSRARRSSFCSDRRV